MLKNERYNKLIEELNNKLLQPQLKLQLPENQDRTFTIETYKIIRSSLLVKYIKSVKAIAFLDMNGFFEDAKIILRTVYEIMIILLYSNMKPEEYFNRFKKYNCVITKKNLMNIKKNIFKIRKMRSIGMEKHLIQQ